ncbi:MAG: two-component regulator propeller domain-containing protein [Paludibacter sp.]|nr:two-component regulator propeller domain-containing protein [Paludibacter sp.]
MHLKTLIVIFVAIFLSQVTTYGETEGYREFNNYYPESDASVINCFAQDTTGLIWFGTYKGLYCYNGLNSQSHIYVPKQSDIKTDLKISCLLFLKNKFLWIGTDNGILRYNTFTDQYEQTGISLQADTRALAVRQNELWIGTLNGLYYSKFKNGQLTQLFQINDSVIPHRTIYSLLNTRKNTLYIGTYNGLCFLNEKNNRFHTIPLPRLSKKNSLLVNALFEDTIRNCIWVGTEGSLFCYFPEKQKVEEINALNGNSIKSLGIGQDHNLLIGTDNGLYIYQPEQKLTQQVVHDSRDNKSLINNIIWDIFTDRDQNVWFGTDYGISHYIYNKTYDWVPLSQITGLGDGNQLQCIFKDSRNNMWFGGTNGLICQNLNGSYIWYKMGDKQHSISHNRIRNIYEDQKHQLWVATDGSINRYDYTQKQFIRYNIVDKTKNRNANWAYQIIKDKSDNLWIATCLGGVFCVDPRKLLENNLSYYSAEKNFYKNKSQSGLSDNYILHITSDKNGFIWALAYNNKINKINPYTGEVTVISYADPQLANGRSYSLICDKEGYIWVGFSGGLCKINPENDKIENIQTNILKDIRVRTITEENKYIWISGPDGTFALNKFTLQLQQVRILNKDFSCSFYDPATKLIYLGGVDGFAVFPSDIIEKNNLPQKPVLTGIYINDVLLQAGKDYAGVSAHNLKRIKLKYNQNNVGFEISDLKYAQEDAPQYIYQLEGADQNWRTPVNGSKRIAYTNLLPGKYTLQIGLPSTGNEALILFKFPVTILPPWYYGFWAKLIYILLIIGLVYWIIIYFRDKHIARIERIEKEKTLELSRLKIDFFTNVSHDFKTPLSLILGPVDQLLANIKNGEQKKLLQLIRKNALHINTLIQQVMGFERLETSPDNTLICSRVEFVEFCRGIFLIYEEAFRKKDIQYNFHSDFDKIEVSIDVVKFESIINNLLSNACKYCDEGSSVKLSLKTSGDNLLIIVSDTGSGIPAKDLPYVFDRFFQSGKNKNKHEGSGIGLYMAKNYVELHKGTISIVSEENKGTAVSVSIYLPDITLITNNIIKDNTKNIEIESDNESRPLILIVEDNVDVCNFIQSILQEDYQCITAHNGKTGLMSAISEKPDLIITDVMMPVMDGMEMCKQLRKNKETALVPLIMLTAKGDKTTEGKSFELDINAFIQKPFDTELLKLKIKQLLNRNEKVKEIIRIEAITTPKEIEAQSWDEKFLNNITTLIEDKIAETDLNVNLISEITGISPKQIYRHIKQLTGLTPVEYIRSIRMKKAAMLLAQQKFTVSEVMYLVGFSNYSYFSKCFQSIYGVSPKQYQQ